MHHYDLSVSYTELIQGYELSSLQARRKFYILKLLYSLLRGQIDSPYLLSKINFHLPPRTSRMRVFLSASRSRTNLLSDSPIETMIAEYNKVVEVNDEIDIFFDTKQKFEKKSDVHSQLSLLLILWRKGGGEGNGGDTITLHSVLITTSHY